MQVANFINNITSIIKNISECKILEIGCGNGNMALLLAPFCIKYDAIDMNSKSISNAINNTPNIYKNLHFYNYTLKNNKLDNKYDAIISCRSFHYGKELLNNNGIIIIIDIIITETTKWQDDKLNKTSSEFDQEIYNKKKQEIDLSRQFLLQQKNIKHFIKDNYNYFIYNKLN